MNQNAVQASAVNVMLQCPNAKTVADLRVLHQLVAMAMVSGVLAVAHDTRLVTHHSSARLQTHSLLRGTALQF